MAEAEEIYQQALAATGKLWDPITPRHWSTDTFLVGKTPLWMNILKSFSKGFKYATSRLAVRPLTSFTFRVRPSPIVIPIGTNGHLIDLTLHCGMNIPPWTDWKSV